MRVKRFASGGEGWDYFKSMSPLAWTDALRRLER